MRKFEGRWNSYTAGQLILIRQKKRRVVGAGHQLVRTDGMKGSLRRRERAHNWLRPRSVERDEGVHVARRIKAPLPLPHAP